MGRTAVLGAGGYVGRHVAAALAGGRHTQRSELEWGSGRPDVAALRLAETGHERAVLAAAVSSIAACERDPAMAWRVNVAAPVHLAERLLADGIAVTALSSDYVFDGLNAPYADDAARSPLNVYGRCKAELEERLGTLDGVLIARLSKVYGLRPGDGTLLDEMASTLLRGEVVRAASDQRFNPIAVDDLVACLLALHEAGAAGIVNVCPSEACSRAALAHRIAAALGIADARIEEISLGDLDEPFERPTDTTMDNTRLREITHLSPRPVTEGIAALAAAYR